MKVKFNEIFQVNKGRLFPLRKIRVGGASYEKGALFAFGGVDFREYIGHDLEIEEKKDILIIKGIF